jgi:hypothetical protein
MKTNAQLCRCFYTVQEQEFIKVCRASSSNLKNVTPIKEMAVHAWDEVYGYKFATKINQSMEM